MDWIYYAGGALILIVFGMLGSSGGSLMRLFYGKPVFVDSSAQARARAEEALKGAHVRFSVETIKSKSSYLQGMDAAAHMRYNLAYNAQESGGPSFVYKIYVPRRLRERALEVLHRGRAAQ